MTPPASTREIVDAALAAARVLPDHMDKARELLARRGVVEAGEVRFLDALGEAVTVHEVLHTYLRPQHPELFTASLPAPRKSATVTETALAAKRDADHQHTQRRYAGKSGLTLKILRQKGLA